MSANDIYAFNPSVRVLRRVFHFEIRKRKGRSPT